jgi:hypothetical protein
MKATSENYICSNYEEWRGKLINLATSIQAREKYMSSAAAYLESNCSAKAIFNTYDTIFFG